MKKNLLLTLFAIIVLTLVFGLAWTAGWRKPSRNKVERPQAMFGAEKSAPNNLKGEYPEIEKKLVIETLIELQKRVGARPDGKIGPETTRLVNAQCERDKLEYHNKLAKPYFTPSGRPK